MSIEVHNRTYIGVSSLAIKRQATTGSDPELVYNLPVPSTFVLQTNVQEKQIMGRNKLGRQVRLRSVPISEMPILQINYDHIQPELITFKVGLMQKSFNLNVHYPVILHVTKDTYQLSEILPTNSFGATTPATDIQGVEGSYLPYDTPTATNIKSKKMTIGTSNDAEATPSNAQDALLILNNNATQAVALIKFAASIIGQVVTLVFRLNNRQVLAFGNELIGDVSITAALVNTANKIDIFHAPSATISLENSQIEFGSDRGMEMTFYLNNPPGSCYSWNIYQTNMAVTC